MENFKTTENVQGVVDINTQTDLSIRGQTVEGTPFVFDSFRDTLYATDEQIDPERVLANANLGITADQSVDTTFVRIPKRLEAAKEHTIEYVREHKKRLVVVGSAVITIAAGTGMLVRRIRKISK